jgi:hypothetical protein
MAKPTIKLLGRHWRTLATLILSILFSSFCAIGHHAFYQNLAGDQVSTKNALKLGGWNGLSSQKFNTAIGNSFALLFRSFLSVTVATAYTQMIWRSLKTGKTGLAVVDALSSALRNPLSFFCAGAWKGSGTLLTLALIIWYV